jgi:hypothetical protein
LAALIVQVSPHRWCAAGPAFPADRRDARRAVVFTVTVADMDDCPLTIVI